MFRKTAITMALICSVALATGGENGAQEPKQETAPNTPTVNPQVTDPVVVNIEEEALDHWGLAIKYVLPVMAVTLIGGWYAKRRKKEEGDAAKGTEGS